MKKVYRRISTVTSVCVGSMLFLTGTSFVSALPLAPGTQLNPVPFEPEPAGGILEASVPAPYANLDIQGTVISSVYSGDASNPFGGLTFTYQVIADLTSTAAVEFLTSGNFGNFLTDVSYDDQANFAAVGGVVPNFASRSLNGNVISFNFFPGVLGGQYSALLVVQTDAMAYAPSVASVINATAITVPSLAPVPVPEPGAFALAGFGVLVLTILGRRR